MATSDAKCSVCNDLCNEILLFSQTSAMIKIPYQKMTLQINWQYLKQITTEI